MMLLELRWVVVVAVLLLMGGMDNEARVEPGVVDGVVVAVGMRRDGNIRD